LFILVIRFESWEFFGIVTVTSSTLLFALIQIKIEAFFAPLCELQCGNMRAQPTTSLNPPQQGSALVLTNSRNHRTCRFATDLSNSSPCVHAALRF
jgi:hypothetical protein